VITSARYIPARLKNALNSLGQIALFFKKSQKP